MSYTLIGADGRPYESPTPGRLGGHRRTKVYGRLDCPVALSLIARGRNVVEHRVFFADEKTAIAAGYRPCGACMRDAYRARKAKVNVHADAGRASGGRVPTGEMPAG